MKRMKVGFILHPLNVSEFSKRTDLYYPFGSFVKFGLKFFEPSRIKLFYSNLPPHKIMEIKNVRSSHECEIDLLGIMCCMFPGEFIKNKSSSIKKVADSINCATKRGVNIVILTGFTSIVWNKFTDEIRKRLINKDVVITSGNNYTACLIIQEITNVCKKFNVDTEDLTLSIIGATGEIGSICSKILSKLFKQTISYISQFH